MHELMRRGVLGLALPLVVGAPAVLLAEPAHATGFTVLVAAPASIVYGQPTTATATVTDGGEPVTAGSVQFSVSLSGAEPDTLGAPVPLDATGHATSPVLAQSDGRPLDITVGSDAWSVHAVYSNGEPAASGDSLPIAVTQAASTVAVQPTATTLVADITGAVPGGTQANSLLPAGPVQFKVNGVDVGSDVAVNGRATLSYVLPSGPQAVTATYAGDDRYTGSAQSLTRRDPVLEARVISELPRSKSGWYRTPVDLWFVCRPQGSELVEECPADVTLKHSGKGQSVTRTVHALDGGNATVTVSGIDIDREKPKVTVTGRSCTATDKLSGVKGRCHLHVHGDGTYTAVAVDKAGNRAVRHGRLP
jgi:hypothetical protein